MTPHELFGRSGDNLTLTVPVTFPELALGTTLTVPTLAGTGVAEGARRDRIRAQVPGEGCRCQAQGLRTGDLIVTVEVAVPQKLSKEATEALSAFAAAQDADPREQITRAVAGAS